MARIKDSSVAQVKATAGIVEVVSARTSLRKRGTRHWGRCPFHEERTPSFSVDEAEGMYYCFGCNRGGDVLRFVQETENVDFVGAVELLAERFRVTLEYDESSPAAEQARARRERLLKLLEQAATYFERLLWEGGAGAAVREYLEGRGLHEPIAREFRLGLAPGSGVVAKARERGFTLDEARAAGLANARGNDYFPFRLVFPLADPRGRVIGFQARKLRDDDPLQGKYVNTPEGELFKKGNVLYGLHLARPAIARQDRAIVVEGNTDVIALRQAGLEPVVASMGTALTEHQLRELGRLTKRLVLCFDSDAAGQDATLRGMELAVGQGFEVHVVTLPEGKDPADEPAALTERLGAAEPYLTHRVRLVLDRQPDRQRAFDEVRAFLAVQPSSPERDGAVAVAVDRLGLPRETAARLLPAQERRDGMGVAESRRVLERDDRLEKTCLAAAVAHPSVARLVVELAPDHFAAELHRRLVAWLVEGGDGDDELTTLRAELGALADRDAIDERTGTEAVLRLRERRIRRELRGADLARATELQAHLARVRAALAEIV